MHIGVIRISLVLPSRTLKEKRTIVRSVVERLRNRFNAAVAEVDNLDTPGRTTIAASVISTSPAHAQAQLQEIAGAIAHWRLDAEITGIETETIAF
ncbi:MAG: DUF503 domain-containing protein [Dehalococcoidia bacterium]|nr:DUF503 domain-containing protein [Dehalococcoidia bacterium]MCA9831804.1 DUF503 domain-containing protein [Dehalococcoidia bacterium]MCB9484934.1 DUF503 domain-containing protein [Thermoflexaceae bacterium]